MLHGSCVSERPACSRSAGGMAASAAVPGAAEQVTSLAPVELPVPPCSARVAASEYCRLEHRTTQRCNSPAATDDQPERLYDQPVLRTG